MEMMTLASLCIMVGYLLAMAKKYGRQEVISEYAYKGGAWLFSYCPPSKCTLFNALTLRQAIRRKSAI